MPASLHRTCLHWRDGLPAMVLVIAMHALALAIGLWAAVAPAPLDDIVPPTLNGMLVADASQQLSEPVPARSAQPVPAPSPESALSPIQTPPTHRSITQPVVQSHPKTSRPRSNEEANEESTEPASGAATNSVATGDASDHASSAAPVTPPLASASYLNNPAPVYPKGARRRGEHGQVQLELLVRADGTVGDIAVARSSGYEELDEAALAAVKRWRFIPASRAGMPIDYRYVLPINFDLRH